MNIFDENMETYVFDNIYTPTPVEYFYALDLSIMDYVLAPLLVLEEIISPAFKVVYNGYEFYLPASYYVMIYSEETSQLDMVEVSEIINNDLPVFAYDGKGDNLVYDCQLKVIDYVPKYVFSIPFLEKDKMLCHPIAPEVWINIGQADQYKSISGKLIGDLI